MLKARGCARDARATIVLPDLQQFEYGRDQRTVEDHGENDDDGRRRVHQRARVRGHVAKRQGEGERAAQSGEDEHHLPAPADRVLANQIENEREGDDAQNTGEANGHLGGEIAFREETWKCRLRSR